MRAMSDTHSMQMKDVIAFICAYGQHQPAIWQAGINGCAARCGLVE